MARDYFGEVIAKLECYNLRLLEQMNKKNKNYEAITNIYNMLFEVVNNHKEELFFQGYSDNATKMNVAIYNLEKCKELFLK